MIIGIIGSGGREHAICSNLIKSKKVEKIFCFPGNAGTEYIAKNVTLDLNNFDKLKNYILREKI
jgi:phosphoribosylamine--glycine ligase